ncbi:hypothetical protein F5J12DRAFT_355578 [Pisolithus orientalis]|uniref:uncharacterized protein n=1 Tax=Pisolithus orientalis TaxID=936130 RepID=UPI0022245E76|nr:uncharacterized protein F5J12DRAFT_355578 [Pisolithus orientalis]KAI5996478.1 hypothetical protein F5J12DRAFT_355578 [Pisolithus orientalis]
MLVFEATQVIPIILVQLPTFKKQDRFATDTPSPRSIVPSSPHPAPNLSFPDTSYSNDMGIPDGFGSALIGGLISAMLYGITTLQTSVYYMHYAEDAPTTKFLVAAIWILDTIHISFICHMLYYYLITNYGVPTSLERIVWSFPASLLVNVLVVCIVQCVFAHIIYCLCRHRVKWLVTAPIILLILVHFGFALETAILMFINQQFSILTQARFYAVAPALAIVALVEVLITVSLCVLFYDGGSRSGFPRSKRLFHTLIIYAINRCCLTLLVTVAELAVNLDQLNNWTIGLDFIIGKLYANSLLASLNSREHLRSKDEGTLPDLPVSTIHFANPLKLPGVVESSKDGTKQFIVPEVAVTDTTTDPVPDKTMVLQREGEV